MNPTPSDATSHIFGDFREEALQRYVESREDLHNVGQNDTTRVSLDLVDDLRRGADAVRSGRIHELSAEQRGRSADAADAVANAIEAFAWASVPAAKGRAS